MARGLRRAIKSALLVAAYFAFLVPLRPADGGLDTPLAKQIRCAAEARHDLVEVEWESDSFLSEQELGALVLKTLEGDLYLQASVERLAMEYRFDGKHSRLVAKFQYRLTDEEQSFVERRAQRALENILHEGMDSVGKIKAIHDHVISILDYDMSGKNDDAYSALTTGKATCQGYSLSFYEILRRAGFLQQLVAGNDHMWNRVFVDGGWYHVDCTYDDQSQGISYKYFLKSDAEMESLGHTWSSSGKFFVSFH